MAQELFLNLLRLSNPYLILNLLSQYLLGLGVARYLGSAIDWNMAVVGVAWLICVHLFGNYLFAYFESNKPQFEQIIGNGKGKLPKWILLLVASGMLIIATGLIYSLIHNGFLKSQGVVIVFMIVLISMFYSLPPLRLSRTGVGEVFLSAGYGFLAPAFAFVLQVGNNHKLLVFSTIPVVLLGITVSIAFELAQFDSFKFLKERNMLFRLGWENAMVFHNSFLLMSFLSLAFAAQIGLPILLALPAFMPLPLAILQIWTMRNISKGMKPNWRIIKLNSVVIYSVVTYLLTISFWTR